MLLTKWAIALCHGPNWKWTYLSLFSHKKRPHRARPSNWLVTVHKTDTLKPKTSNRMHVTSFLYHQLAASLSACLGLARSIDWNDGKMKTKKNAQKKHTAETNSYMHKTQTIKWCILKLILNLFVCLLSSFVEQLNFFVFVSINCGGGCLTVRKCSTKCCLC